MRTVYKCDDGSDFAVDWEDPADAAITWMGEREHFGKPPLPIEIDTVTRVGMEAAWRPFALSGLPVPPVLIWQGRVVNGWLFISVPPNLQEGMGESMGAMQAFVEKNGGPTGVWENVCLPPIKQLVEKLRLADENASADALVEQQWEAWGWTMMAIVAAFGPLLGLVGFLGENFGPEAETLAGELTSGYMHATVEADEDLWQVAKRSEAVREALHDGPPFDMAALRRDKTFWDAYTRYMQVYGERPDAWQLCYPTLNEQPDKLLNSIKQTIEGDLPSPAENVPQTAARREQLLEETAARLGDPAKAGALRGLVAAAASYTPVREGRAYWQLLAWGRLRGGIIRIGGRLVREGRIEKPEDALYLSSSEMQGEGEHDLRATVAQRRADWERAAAMSPPDVIGAPGPSNIVAAMGPPVQEAPVAANQIRGAAASRGKITAIARVIRSVEDGKRLQPGEVLVTQMTAPPWTPLFAVAGAVVTESGGALSHPSIVAREYGIPCVVGAKGATSRIRDGQTITVDGDKGIVTLED